MKKIPIGYSDFKELIEGGFYFVDKSLFIKEIIEDNNKVILLPRPRRFGKTLNLSMLHYFFSEKDKESNESLFKGLNIKNESIFKTHFGKYPVIYLTFKDEKKSNFEDFYRSITLLLSYLFRKFSFLLENHTLSSIQKKEFEEIINQKASRDKIEKSLIILSEYLANFYKTKIIILIDEYDTPIHASYLHGFYDETITFMRSLLGAGLKDNTNLYKGIITGILRISKESVFSGMNNLGVFSLIKSEYNKIFGFTETELVELLKYFNLESFYSEIRDWYNGYNFGGKIIYNPWSVLNFLSSKDKNPEPYWINTSSNDIIKKLVKESSSNLKDKLQQLLTNNPVVTKLDENIVFKELMSNDRNVFSFLTFSGYLKASFLKHEADENLYQLAIPNKEVRRTYRDIIENWINEPFGNQKLNQMLQALVNGDVRLFEKLLSLFVVETLSYFDTEKRNIEKTYQPFLLGMLINLEPEYFVESEKESGYGRYDISILPKDITKTAIIMELKAIDEFDGETKNTALENALTQIEERQYEAAIRKRGYKIIQKMAVTFDGKRVWVKIG